MGTSSVSPSKRTTRHIGESGGPEGGHDGGRYSNNNNNRHNKQDRDQRLSAHRPGGEGAEGAAKHGGGEERPEVVPSEQVEDLTLTQDQHLHGDHENQPESLSGDPASALPNDDIKLDKMKDDWEAIAVASGLSNVCISRGHLSAQAFEKMLLARHAGDHEKAGLTYDLHWDKKDKDHRDKEGMKGQSEGKGEVSASTSGEEAGGKGEGDEDMTDFLYAGLSSLETLTPALTPPRADAGNSGSTSGGGGDGALSGKGTLGNEHGHSEADGGGDGDGVNGKEESKEEEDDDIDLYGDLYDGLDNMEDTQESQGNANTDNAAGDEGDGEGDVGGGVGGDSGGDGDGVVAGSNGSGNGSAAPVEVSIRAVMEALKGLEGPVFVPAPTRKGLSSVPAPAQAEKLPITLQGFAKEMLSILQDV
ncbi:unnamed protein product [Discosporangium mesarthrocarpum]